MIWKVETKEGELMLSDIQVVDILLKHLTEQEKKDCWTVNSAFLRFAQAKQIVGDMSLQQFGYMCFMLGYYYKVFLTKNKTEIEDNENTDNAESGH